MTGARWVARVAMDLSMAGAAAVSQAAPNCMFEQPLTTVVAPAAGEMLVRAATTSYRCTGLTPGTYYYFCAAGPGAPAPGAMASAETALAASRVRRLNLFGAPLVAGNLLRAFRADGPTREETVPLFRLGILGAADAAAGVERPRDDVQALDVVEGSTVFSSREGCGSGRHVVQAQVAVPLRIVRLATCEISLTPQLAFGRAPPSWDMLPDPAARLDLRCAAQLPWRVSLDNGAQGAGDGPLRRKMTPLRVAYGVRVGEAGERDFTGVPGYGGVGSVLMRGYLPGNPRAEGIAGLEDTLVTTVDF